MGENYYRQLFLEEQISEYIIKDIEISSDESDKEDPNKEHSKEGNSGEENRFVFLEISPDEKQFFFDKHSKKYHVHENFVVCKLLPLLKYALIYTLNYTLNYTVSFLHYS